MRGIEGLDNFERGVWRRHQYAWSQTFGRQSLGIISTPRLRALQNPEVISQFRQGGISLPDRASFDDLPHIRQGLGVGDNGTVVLLEADDLNFIGYSSKNPYFGFPDWRRTGFQARKHAEADALYQFFLHRQTTGMVGGKAYLAVDRLPCAYCVPSNVPKGFSFGIPQLGDTRSIFARGVEYNQLESIYVETPDYLMEVGDTTVGNRWIIFFNLNSPARRK